MTNQSDYGMAVTLEVYTPCVRKDRAGLVICV